MTIDHFSFKQYDPIYNNNQEDKVPKSVDYLIQMCNFATLRDTEGIYYYNLHKEIFILVDLLDKINKLRGDIPRSHFIVRLLEQVISKRGKFSSWLINFKP